MWGPIYGYVSLESDMNTIHGVTFDHKGETPGLGAEINTTPFESMFNGKKIFESDKFVSIGVSREEQKSDDPHAVLMLFQEGQSQAKVLRKCSGTALSNTTITF